MLNYFFTGLWVFIFIVYVTGNYEPSPIIIGTAFLQSAFSFIIIHLNK